MQKVIRDYLRKHELSQRQFADQLGIDKSNLSRILSGERSPSLDVLKKISARTGKSLDELVG